MGSGRGGRLVTAYAPMPSRARAVALGTSVRAAVAALAGSALMVLALTAASHAQVNGLVAAYSFNEGAGTAVADASGAGNSGVVSNATWATGKYGGGLVFNGTSSRVNVSSSSSLQLTSAMTLEAWVNP